MTSIEEKIRRVKSMDSGGVVELLKKDSSEMSAVTARNPFRTQNTPVQS